jgi:hypothetical protein
MINESKASHVGSDASQGKRAWDTPTLSRIKASEAEVGTRNVDDGAFTDS